MINTTHANNVALNGRLLSFAGFVERGVDLELRTNSLFEDDLSYVQLLGPYCTPIIPTNSSTYCYDVLHCEV